MFNFWLVTAGFLAGLHCFARWREMRWLHYATKPTVLLALIIWSWQLSAWQGQMRWFGVALLCSLLGDVLLMLPPGFFLAGLGAFLLGHIFYIVGFNTDPLIVSPPFWIFILLVFLTAAGLIRYFLRILRRKTVSRHIRLAVVVYIIVILLMFLSAGSTFFRPDWGMSNAIKVTTGALLFGISDGLLAVDRFVKKVWHAHHWIMLTYYLAQFFILWGALGQFV